MKKFSKKKEDFTCKHCGAEVSGDGYTNHCPKCLWSRHVDINPGDRAQECGGMMRPVDAYLEGQEWVLVHKCESCGETKRNRVDEADDFNQVIALVKEISDRKSKR